MINDDTAFGTYAATRKQIISAVTSSLLGWSLDLYDLFILLYVAPVVGRLFFPSTHATWSLAAVYTSFAVTLLMRPIGSAIFGHFADVHGRKNAMLIAICGVGISTAAFGLLPTIYQIGLYAPILFFALRMVQGIFVGGVVASTHTIGTESVPENWRGTVSGLVGGGGAAVGALIASFVFLLVSHLFPGAAFAEWGWRVMFFSGIISSLLGWFVFQNLEESPFWKELRARKIASQAVVAPAPLKRLFSAQYRKVLLLNLLITIGGGAGYYLTSGYMPAFLKVVNKVPNQISSLILMGGGVSGFVASIAIGMLSDRIGRKKTFLIVSALAAILLPVCYLGMAAATTIPTITLYALAIAFIGNTGYAPALIFLNERFPTEIRASGTGLSWNIGFAIGGMLPIFVSLASAAPKDIPSSLSLFAIGVFVLLLIGAISIPETKGNLR